MRKKTVPFALAESIYEVPKSFYLEHGIRFLLLDLDNTLVPYSVSYPDERFLSWAKEMEDAGLSLCICSNNSGKRVSNFALAAGCQYASYMRKPFSGPMKKLLKKKGWPQEETLLIGDQIMTDVKAGNGAGVRCLLTEPLDSQEPPWTKFNRIFDRPKRKKIKEKGYAKPWKEIL